MEAIGKLHRVLWLLCAILLAACSKPAPQPSHAIDITWQHPEADFRLADAGGRVRSLKDFRGKVVVLFFGYTHCPEVCPTTLADLGQAMRLLGPDAKRVQVLFVTLDPERDTPQVLAQFVPYFDASFIGLRGDAEATGIAAKSFGVNYERQVTKKGDYTLDHSDSTYLIGATGKPLWMSRYGQRVEFLVEDIRRLLAAAAE